MKRLLGIAFLLVTVIGLTACGKVDLSKDLTGITASGAEHGYDVQIQPDKKSSKALMLDILKVKNDGIGLSDKQLEQIATQSDTIDNMKADKKKILKLVKRMDDAKIDFKFSPNKDLVNGQKIKVTITDKGDPDADKFDVGETKTLTVKGLEQGDY